MNDNEIKQFFHDNRPVPKDMGTYLVGLSARMDAAEEIKRLCEKSRKDSRRVLLMTFIFGCLFGAFIIAFLFFVPSLIPGALGGIVFDSSAVVEQFSTPILILIPSLGMLFGYILWKA